MEYRVDLDIFNGPMDLLLHLIRRDELDILNIPIARITDSYMAYLGRLREAGPGLDVNTAGEFLVMAATLMELKSASLLPPATGQQVDAGAGAESLMDPRTELVRRLLEYKRFKDSAVALERLGREFAFRHARIPASETPPDETLLPLDLDEVQVWDLLDAFGRLMTEVGIRGPRDHEIIDDDTPLDLHAADIEDRLRREHRLSFRSLLGDRRSRAEMIGVFLALLELIRQRKVSLREAGPVDGPLDYELSLVAAGEGPDPGGSPSAVVDETSAPLVSG